MTRAGSRRPSLSPRLRGNGELAMRPSEKLSFDRCRGLLDRLLADLQARAGESLLAVALFGSVARGEGGRTSDLDLLIVHRADSAAILHEFVMSVLALRHSGEYLQLREDGFLPDPYAVFMTTAQLGRHPWILLDVLDDGIVLLDREGLLQRELDRVRERLNELRARRVVAADGTWYWDLKPDWKPGEVIEL